MEIQNVKVRKAVNITSDHYLSQTKINFLPYRGKRNIRIKIPRVDRDQLGRRSGNFGDLLKPPKDWKEVTENLVSAVHEIAPLQFSKSHA